MCTANVSGGTASSSCTGELAGLGNEDLLIETTLEGFAVFQCEDKGGNRPPGQNKVLVGPTTTPTVIGSEAIKNGRVRFTALGGLAAPTTVSGAEAGCPDNDFTGLTRPSPSPA